MIRATLYGIPVVAFIRNCLHFLWRATPLEPVIHKSVFISVFGKLPVPLHLGKNMTFSLYMYLGKITQNCFFLFVQRLLFNHHIHSNKGPLSNKPFPPPLFCDQMPSKLVLGHWNLHLSKFCLKIIIFFLPVIFLHAPDMFIKLNTVYALWIVLFSFYSLNVNWLMISLS